MTRIAWITPEYPPDRGGVGDHSFTLVETLRSLGHEVQVHLSPPKRGFRELNDELVLHQPEVLIVAFVPLGFGPRWGGIAPSFALWSTRLRRRLGSHSLLLAHEASLPALAHWDRRELKLALLGAAQVVQFEILARSFERVVFSHEGSRAIWAKRMPRLSERFRTIRICSNIPRVESDDPRGELAEAGYSVPPRIVLFFGTGHDSVLFDFIEATLIELLKVDPSVQLVIIGMTTEKLRSIRPSLANLLSSVRALGFLPTRDVSLWLQAAELVLGPFVEGINARRGTAMAALQHGRPLITTRGLHTRTDIPWSRICAVAPLEREAFAALAVAYFRDPVGCSQLGAAAKDDYEKHASAAVTAAGLLALALGARSKA